MKRNQKALPDLSSLIGSVNPGMIKFKMIGGIAIGTPICSCIECRSIRLFMPNCCVFPELVHPDPIIEIVVVQSGKFTFCVKVDETWIERPMSKGEVGYVYPGQLHKFVILEDTTIRSISIPPDEGYCNGS